MFGVSDMGLIIVVGLAILMFGAPKIVDWAKSLGEAKKAFADASNGKTVNLAWQEKNTSKTDGTPLKLSQESVPVTQPME